MVDLGRYSRGHYDSTWRDRYTDGEKSPETDWVELERVSTVLGRVTDRTTFTSYL